MWQTVNPNNPNYLANMEESKKEDALSSKYQSESILILLSKVIHRRVREKIKNNH